MLLVRFSAFERGKGNCYGNYEATPMNYARL